MGMYTEVFFRAYVDEAAADVLQRLRNGKLASAPDHPFFSTERCSAVVNGGSSYFPDANHFVVTGPALGGQFSVSFRANLKNYDDEIGKFFDWVQPHVFGFEGDFIGYTLYEEDDVPTLIYKIGDRY